MVKGVGCDLVEIDRIKKACFKEAFVVKYFTESERAIFKRQSLSEAAGNFAVKEAVAKAFGTGFRGFSPIDIEVLRDELGKPYVKLHGQAKTICEEMSIQHIFVTISNTDTMAMAVAVGEGD